MSVKTARANLETIIQGMNDLLRSWGLTYMYLSRPIADKYGKKGEIIIREGLRSFGAFRGSEVRKWHISEGLPLTMENLMRFWDAASVYTIQDDLEKEGLYTPYYVRFPVRTCVAQQTWAEEGYEDRGYWYCDEIHFAVANAYNKDAIAEIHENLNKGDKFCGFHWMQIPAGPVDNSAAEALFKRMNEHKEEFALECLKRTARCVGMLYVFLAKSIVQYLGNEGREILRNAVIALGQKRGKRLKQQLEVDGKAPNVENIFNNFDLPYNLLWKIKESRADGKYTVIVEYCPFAELWGEVNLKDLGAIYCNHIYESIFKVFNRAADIKIPECMTTGDKRCRFEFKL